MVIMCVCVLLYEKWNVYVHEVWYDVYNMEYEKVYLLFIHYWYFYEWIIYQNRSVIYI